MRKNTNNPMNTACTTVASEICARYKYNKHFLAKNLCRHKYASANVKLETLYRTYTMAKSKSRKRTRTIHMTC